MSLLRAIRLALRSLSRNRLRSAFMMLGVTVGMASLTAVSSVGENAKQETMRRFKRMLGTFDTVIVRPGAARTRGMPSLTTVDPTLTFEDAQAIASGVPSIERVAQVQNAFDVDVKYRDKAISPAVFGVSPDWSELRGDELARGDGISDDDVTTLGRVAVLGADADAALFGGDDPVGQTIRIGDVPFQVKGVLSAHGAGPGGASLDNIVIIPVSTASKRLFNRNFLTMAIAQVKDPARGDEAVEQITKLLRERHRLAASVPDDFTITNPRAAMAKVTEVGSTLSKVLTGVAVLATAIGGVVIMSLMLIGVSERRKEIGVRRSVGASRRDILVQFLIEALTISAIGGIVGIAIGVGGTAAVTLAQQLPTAVVWSVVGAGAGVSLAVGLVFGLHPAWRASTVDPIAALRS
jgi:putative ABC transport system permease protein